MAVRDVQYGTRAVGHRRQRLVERPRRPSPRARSKGDGSRPDIGPAHERFWESSNRSACSGSAAVRSRVTAADSSGGPIWTGHSRGPPPPLRRRPPGWLRAPYGARARPSPAASAASAGLAPSTLRCKSQPTLWGHASRVPGRGWQGVAPPPFDPPDARAPLRCACSPIVRAVSGRARWSLAQAAPLALNGACRRGPRSPPHHRRSPRPHRRRAGGRHDGEVVLGERTGDAVSDGGTHRLLPRQRRGKLGVQGGRSVPLARPQCFTLRRLAPAP